jgi:hypothetical protein
VSALLQKGSNVLKYYGKDAHELRAKDLPDIPDDDDALGGEDAELGAAFYA